MTPFYLTNTLYLELQDRIEAEKITLLKAVREDDGMVLLLLKGEEERERLRRLVFDIRTVLFGTGITPTL